MPFVVVELDLDADLSNMVQVEWTSYEQPYCRLIRLFLLIFGACLEARFAAFKGSMERQFHRHKGDSISHSIKAVDREKGTIAGAACWHVYEENPSATQSDVENTWYPPGEGREMANSLMS